VAVVSEQVDQSRIISDRRADHDLARPAADHGIGFGPGSRRAMLVRPETARIFAVRDGASDVLLPGSLGIVVKGP
jgi:hypothetical protein